MIKIVSLFPITLITVYLSGGLNVANVKSKTTTMRKPDWTEGQCWLLAQLVDEHKATLKGKIRAECHSTEQEADVGA